MTAHAILSASSMHRWSACPGSIKLIERLRSQGLASDRTSIYAIEGSAAQWSSLAVVQAFGTTEAIGCLSACMPLTW